MPSLLSLDISRCVYLYSLFHLDMMKRYFPTSLFVFFVSRTIEKLCSTLFFKLISNHLCHLHHTIEKPVAAATLWWLRLRRSSKYLYSTSHAAPSHTHIHIINTCNQSMLMLLELTWNWFPMTSGWCIWDTIVGMLLKNVCTPNLHHNWWEWGWSFHFISCTCNMVMVPQTMKLIEKSATGMPMPYPFVKLITSLACRGLPINRMLWDSLILCISVQYAYLCCPITSLLLQWWSS